MTNFEELLKKNGVEQKKLATDKDRIAQLEEINAELLDAVMELAEIIGGVE